MLDDILNRVRRGAERVQRRSEEVAQTARLRVEVFQLTRELDTLYARLGRSYHAGADPEVLHSLREEIRRVDEEIQARERLMEELNQATREEQNPAGESAVILAEVGASRTVTVPSTPATPTATEPNIPSAVPRPREDTSGTPEREGDFRREHQPRENSRAGQDRDLLDR